MPMMTVPTMRVVTFWAVAQMMLPITPRAAPQTKMGRRPKMSETRPMMVRQTAEVRV